MNELPDRQGSACALPSGTDRESGMALAVVLWSLSAAALLIAAFSASVRSGGSTVLADIDDMRTQAVLDAGIELAALRLIDPDEARRLPVNDEPQTLTLNGHKITIYVSEPDGRVDLNLANKRTLEKLLRPYTSSPDAARLTGSIMRAREMSSAPPQAKSRVRIGLTFQRVPPDSQDGRDAAGPRTLAFIDVAQLRQVPGVTPQLYRQLAPFLTVYSKDGRVNRAAATPEVDSALFGGDQRNGARDRGGTGATAALGSRGPNGLSARTRRSSRGEAQKQTDRRAYSVRVEVRGTGNVPLAARNVVLATGVDSKAPYRVLRVEPAM